jgi:hypothetical protein
MRVLVVLAPPAEATWRAALESFGVAVTLSPELVRPDRELPYDMVVSSWSPAWRAVLDRAIVPPEFIDCSHALTPDFVAALGDGVHGRWCPDPQVLLRALGPRPRRDVRVPIEGLTLEWAGGGVGYPVLECSSYGFSFFLAANQLDWSVRRYALLRGVRLSRSSRTVLEAQDAEVVQLSAAAGGFRVGCRLVRQDTATPKEVVGPEQIASLLSRSLALRGVKLRSLERTSPVISVQGAAAPAGGDGIAISAVAHPFEPLEVVEGWFSRDALLHRFVTVVLAQEPLTLRLPRRFSVAERRQRTRLAARNLVVALKTPLADEPLFTSANVLDVSVRGLGVDVDEALPWPVGLSCTLDHFEGERAATLPRGLEAVVRSRQPRAPGRVRLGIELVRSPPDASTRLADLLGTLEADIVDGRSCGFEALWKLFRDTALVSDEASQLLAPYMEQVRHTHERLFAAPPSLYLSRVVLKGGEPIAHMSAVRQYRRTWYVFQQAARMSSRHASFAITRAFVTMLEQLGQANLMRMTYAEENKWSRRIYGTFLRRVRDPMRSVVRALDVIQVSLMDRPETVPTGAVRPVSSVEQGQLLDYLIRHEAPLVIESLELDEAGLGLSRLGVEYRDCGLARERRAYAVEVQGRRAAWCLVEDSTVGIDFRGQLSGVMVWHLDPAAVAINTAATRTLLAWLLEERRRSGPPTFPVFHRAVGLLPCAPPELIHPPIRAVDVTVHRDVFPMFVEHMRELGARLFSHER